MREVGGGKGGAGSHGIGQEQQDAKANLTACRHLFEQMVDGYLLFEIIFDADRNPCDYRCVDINAAFASLIGMPRDEIIGRPARDLLPGEDWLDAYNEVAQTGSGTKVVHPAFGHTLEATIYRPMEHYLALLFRDVTDAVQVEQTLRGSLTRCNRQTAELSAIYRTAPIGLSVLDAQLRFLHVNERLAAINGLPAGAHIGKTVREVVPEVAKRLEPLLRQVLATGEPILEYESSWELAAQPGMKRHWVSHFWPMKDEEGRVYGINVVAEEVTERKRAEEAVQREQAFRALAENSPDVIVRFDQQLRRIYANPAIEKFVGRPREFIIGKTNRELGLPPSVAEFLDEQLRQTFRSGQPRTFEVTLPTPNGHRQLESSLVPEPGPDGPAKTILGISRDITARNEAEGALRESEQRYRELVENLHEGIWLIDRDANTVFVNAQMAELLGYSPDEILRRSLFEFMDAASRETALTVLIRCHSGARTVFDVDFLRQDGSRVCTRTVAAPLFDEAGNYKGALAGVIDISDRKRTEEALRESEQRLRLANEATGIGTWSLYPEAGQPDWDVTTREQWGFSPDEPLSLDKIYARVHQEDRPKLDAAIEAMASGMAAHTVELRVHRPDGTIRHLRSTGRPLTDGGRTIRIVGTSLDVSDEKTAEQSLRDYANGLDLLSGTAQQMLQPLSRPEIFRFVTERIYALSEGGLVLFSEFDAARRQTVLREIGCTDAERAAAQRLLGRNPVGLRLEFPESTRQRMLPGELALVEGGLCDLAFYQLPQAVCEALERELNLNEAFAMACSVEQDLLGTVAILTHSHGPLRNAHLIQSIVGQAALALQRRRTEEELQRERNFVDAVLDTEGAIVAILDRNHRIVRLNRAFRETTGSRDNDMLGRPFPEIVSRESAVEIQNQLAKLAAGQPVAECETHVQVARRGNRYVRWRITALRDGEGNIEHVIATGIDITDRIVAEADVRRLNEELQRRAEQLEHANSELQSFSYSVTHDLRSPLRAMVGLGEILKEDYSDHLDNAGLQTIDRIIEAGNRMSRLVDEIFNLAAVARKELSLEPIDLSAMVQSIVEELRSQEPDRQVEFIVEQTDPICGDAGLMQIVLTNLLNNAWKYTLKTEQPRIEFGSRREAGNQVFYIRDNGAGFDMQQVDKLFRPFQRLHPEKEFWGTGVGLATVDRIIRRHRGRVWAVGEVGKGATFYFTV